jgi:hypothetical protein
MPNGRCYRHGGATPSGTASPHFKHGRYSKDLPTRIVGRYEELRQDQSLFQLREEIALIDTFIAETLQKLGSGESRWLRKFRHAWQRLEKARHRKDAAAEEKAVARLGELISTYQENPMARRQVVNLIGQRRRLCESERKRRVEARHMVPIEEVMVLMAALTDALKRHVGDREVRAAIGADIERIIDSRLQGCSKELS